MLGVDTGESSSMKIFEWRLDKKAARNSSEYVFVKVFSANRAYLRIS